MSYSQNDEEAVIAQLLGDKVGRLLDIGAHDGVTFSNTRRLALLGWGGTLVEPSPAAFSALMRAYPKRPDMKLVHAAIMADGPQHMMLFHDSRGDMVSTADEKHRALWSGRPGHQSVEHAAAKVDFQPIYVAGISVFGLLTAFPGPYTFVNLDVEGMNYELFAKLPLRAIGCEVVCVEYQDKKAEITACAIGQGYHLRHTTGENLIFSASK